MDQIYIDIIPPLLFFISFFIVFSLFELIIVFFLNRMERKHWEFMIDVVIRAKVHYAKVIKWSVLTVFAALVIFLILFTPFLEVFETASGELKLFAAFLALAMVLIYFLNVRKNTKLDIEKKIYKTVFFILSIVIYVIILIIANESYGRYKEYINTQVINPAIEEVGKISERQEEEELLNKFREMYLNGDCADVDYSQNNGGGSVINFVLVSAEPELSFGDITEFADPKAQFRGKGCTDGENSFLLNGLGRWYWVIEEDLGSAQ